MDAKSPTQKATPHAGGPSPLSGRWYTPERRGVGADRAVSGGRWRVAWIRNRNP